MHPTKAPEIIMKMSMATLILSMLVACGGAEERQQKYLEKAREYFKAENYDKSRIELKNVLQIDPKNAQARLLLAQVHENNGELKNAFINYNSAIEIDPSLVEAHLAISKIYFAANKMPLADEFITKALELDATNKDALVLHAAVEAQKGNTELAINVVNKILSNHPGDPDATAVLVPLYLEEQPNKALEAVNEGLALHSKNIKLKRVKIKVLTAIEQEEGIEEIYKELISENPDRLDFPIALAQRYESLGRVEDAMGVYHGIIRNEDSSEAIIEHYVGFVRRSHGPERAIEILKELVTLKPDVYDIKRALAEVYLQNDDVESARSIFYSVIEQAEEADVLRARNDLAIIKIKENDVEGARKILDEIFSVEANNAPGLILRAQLHMADNNFRDAISDLRAALKNNDQSIDALLLLARCYEKTNSPSLALDSYQKVLSIRSTHLPALMGIAKINIYENKIPQAKEALLRANSISPYFVDAVSLLNKIYIPAKEWQNAEKANRKLINAKDPSLKSKGLILQANVYRAQKNWGEATRLYREALTVGPGEYKALAGTVDSYLVEEKYDEAIKVLEEHHRAYPSLPFVKPLLAHVHSVSGDIDQAIKIHREVIEEYPLDEANYQKLASIYYQQDDLKNTEKTYKKGIEANPRFAGLRILLGNLYERQSRFAESKQQYEAALEINPELAVARNNLAAILINEFPTKDNLKKALRLTEAFKSSKTATYLDTLGWAHYHTGNTPQAISYLQAAIDIQNDPEFQFHLATAYYKEGNTVAAKKSLEIALVDAEGKRWENSAKILRSKL